jgi:gentisate 1,2-dioxygenase
VEVVDVSSIAVRFIINGHHFTPVSGACSGWTAGDGVSLLSGEWHGYCANAVFRNTTRGRTCETSCNTLW